MYESVFRSARIRDQIALNVYVYSVICIFRLGAVMFLRLAHNSLIAETSFSFISSLFSLIVVNSFSVSREPITKRGELKSDSRPEAPC